MTAAQLEDPEGRALVAAIHERKAATLCECWTGPARLHTGHCCMREPLPATCHVEEGRAAHHETTGQAAHQEGTP